MYACTCVHCSLDAREQKKKFKSLSRNNCAKLNFVCRDKNSFVGA